MRKVNADRLLEDLWAVVADVDELIKATAGSANEAVAAARKRMEGSLKDAKDDLEKARRHAVEDAEGVAQWAGDYVHDNVWKVIGIAAGVGLVLGMILSRRGGSSREPRD